MSWNLFEDETPENCNTLSGVLSVLTAVSCSFVGVFGEETIQSHPVLSVVYSPDGPITYRKHQLIFLSALGASYHQCAYQFSHELCHFMCFNDVCSEYQWLDETLCQTMSWYSMKWIQENFHVELQDLLPYFCEKVPEYISADMETRECLSKMTIAEFISHHWNHFRHEPYDREKNRTIAYELYPLFCSYPILWKIIPFLACLTSDMSLDTAITTLCNLADIPSLPQELLFKLLLC